MDTECHILMYNVHFTLQRRVSICHLCLLSFLSVCLWCVQCVRICCMYEEGFFRNITSFQFPTRKIASATYCMLYRLQVKPYVQHCTDFTFNILQTGITHRSETSWKLEAIKMILYLLFLLYTVIQYTHFTCYYIPLLQSVV